MNTKQEALSKFFKHHLALRTFGPYSQHMPGLCARIIAQVPEAEDKVLERLDNITLRHSYKSMATGQQGAWIRGETLATMHNDRIHRGIILRMSAPEERENMLAPLFDDEYLDNPKIKKLSYAEARQQFYERKLFYQVMLNALAADSLENTEVVESGKKPTKVGNVVSAYYDFTTPEHIRGFYCASGMVRGGIVENWASELAEMDVNNAFTRTTQYMRSVSYPLATALVTCWNLCSNYQLRHEYMTGESDDSQASRDTEEFKRLMIDFYGSIGYSLPPESKITQISSKEIAERYSELLNFCDKKFSEGKHTNKETQLYNECMRYAKLGLPVVNELGFVFKNNDSKNVKILKRDILVQIQRKIPLKQQLGYLMYEGAKQQALLTKGYLKGDISPFEGVGAKCRRVMRTLEGSKTPAEPIRVSGVSSDKNCEFLNKLDTSLGVDIEPNINKQVPELSPDDLDRSR